MDVKETILNLLQVKYTIPPETDLNDLNYLEEGFVDSLGLIKFICELEEVFKIEFTDEELSLDDFQNVQKLINLVEGKIK